MNPPMPNHSYSPDDFYFQTSSVPHKFRFLVLLDTTEERAFKLVKLAKSVFEIIGLDSSHLSSSQSLPLRKYVYGVDVKNYYLKLPSQKEMYLLHFPHMKTAH